jgi:CRISPR-associated protein Cas5d
MESKVMMLDVWGDLACFTRPELKIERMSYPVPTPSAVRGIYDAIYCKPSRDPAQAEFRWQVKRIDILSPPRFIALRRNEVKDKAEVKDAWVAGRAEFEPIWADDDSQPDKGRTQRQTMALKEVRYRLYAEIRPWPGFEGRLRGLEEQFERRARHGKCIYQPYFGCREFPAYFEFVEPGSPEAVTFPFDLDVGLMLYDVFDLSRPGSPRDEPSVSLFRASVKGGVLTIPDFDSSEVLKGARRIGNA